MTSIPLTPPSNTSRAGLDHLVAMERLVPTMYRDVAGYPTIGIGHLLTAQELATGEIRIGALNVRWDRGLSEEQCYLLLDQDLTWAESAVDRFVTVALAQHQFDALVSFVFNIGPTAFKRSTLLRLLNGGDYRAVPGQLARWVKAGGKVVRGLVNRRNAEIRLWEGA